MNLFEEFFGIIDAFERDGVRYAVVGGVAMAFHDRPRFTRDIDLLVAPDDYQKVEKILVGLGYFPSSKPGTFKKAGLTLHRFLKIESEDDELMVDVLVSEDTGFNNIIRNASTEESDGGHVRIARKKDIVKMKRLRDSDQDKVDIRKLENDED